VPNIIVTHPLAPEDNLALYRQIGDAFDRKREAEALCGRFDAALRSAKGERFPEMKVLYLIWKAPWMTVSRDTYVSRMLALFGAQTLPAAADARYPELPDLAVEGVEAILLSTEPYRFSDKHLREIAAQTGKPVRLIDGEMTSWYGPRAIEGLRYLASFFAPSRSIT
jgi:ABC-type Fe3+-hydroxamate transport system substrate-binding protein